MNWEEQGTILLVTFSEAVSSEWNEESKVGLVGLCDTYRSQGMYAPDKKPSVIGKCDFLFQKWGQKSLPCS